MKRNPIFVLLFFLLFSSCQRGPKTVEEEKDGNISHDTIHIAESAERYDAKDLFESVEITPLESNGRNLVSDVNRLVITKDCFFILDYNLNDIFIFGKDGRYKLSLNSESSDTVKYRDVVHNRHDGHAYVSELHARRVVQYNEDGMVTKNTTINIDYNYFDFLGNDLLFVRNYLKSYKDKPYDKDIRTDLISVFGSETMEECNTFFSYNPSSIYKLDVFDQDRALYASVANPSALYFARFGDLSYYTLDSSGITNRTSVILDADLYPTIPSDFLTNARYKGTRLKYLQENKEKFSFISNISETGRGTILSISSLTGKITVIKYPNTDTLIPFHTI